ncbi:MbnP family protein [Brumimicrobium sp.]|uniref:MbnP family protein n=1 Tax=Brumimicrobium sp. TaxID=2029867 RepID=UPI003A93A77E
MKKLTLFFVLMVFGSLYSCKEKPKDDANSPTTSQLKARVNIVPTYQGTPIDFSQSFTTQEGYAISFTKLNIIMTKFKNNDQQLFESAIYKYEDDERLLWEGPGDYSNFSSFTANIGVDSTQNYEDPSARDADDPLFILNSGDMHWGWNTGYIFVMLEGKADTTAAQDGSLASFSYHIGTNQMLRNFTLTDITWSKVNNHLYESNIYLDLYKVFDGDIHDIDIKTDRTSHTNPDQIQLTEKIIDNFINALSKD